MLPKLLSPATLKAQPEAISHTRLMMANTPVNCENDALKGVAQRVELSSTLIAVGEDDAITPPSDAEAMNCTILAERQTARVTLDPKKRRTSDILGEPIGIQPDAA